MINFIFIYFGLLILYGFGMWTLCILPEVTTSEKTYTGFKNIGKPIKSAYKKNGVKYRKFVISEDCFSFGVRKNQIIDIRCDREIKENDLVVIYQDNENFRGYKLRKVSEVFEDGVLTFFYNEDGKLVYENYDYKSMIGKYEKKN